MPAKYRTSLIEKKSLTYDTDYFKFKLIEPKEINFIAGQFLAIRINGLTRLYSIFSSEKQKDCFELVIKYIPNGVASSYFFNLKVGEEQDFFGPAGFFTLRNNKLPKKMIAIGNGSVPFWSMLKTECEKAPLQTKLELYWGLKSKNDIFGLMELIDIKKQNPNFNFKICLSQETDFKNLPRDTFYKGRVNSHCFFDGEADHEYYICGRREIVSDIEKQLLEKKIPKNKIFFENY